MSHEALDLPAIASAVPKIGFVSLGCPKALTDSELILTQLRAEGYDTSKTFAGDLEPGRSYLGDFIYDANALRIWRPVKDVQLPPNSAWTIDWVNLAKFPALSGAAARARTQRLRFTVLKVDVSSGHPSMPWTVVYHCEVEAIEKPPPVAAPAAKAPPGRSAKMAR